MLKVEQTIEKKDVKVKPKIYQQLIEDEKNYVHPESAAHFFEQFSKKKIRAPKRLFQNIILVQCFKMIVFWNTISCIVSQKDGVFKDYFLDSVSYHFLETIF